MECGSRRKAIALAIHETTTLTERAPFPFVVTFVTHSLVTQVDNRADADTLVVVLNTPYSLGLVSFCGLVSSNRKPGIHVAWKTVTYRSVVLDAAGRSAALCHGDAFCLSAIHGKWREGGKPFCDRLSGEGGEQRNAPEKACAANAQQAHFTALDGTVRVKKSSSNSWVTADYNVPLEKGDVVQTGSEGMAKIVFNDGTNYTVKQDSLIVIEENSANDQQQTNVSVAVSTGTVDLSTATFVQGSKSQVIVAGATASLAPESAARVRNDPKADQHEILLKKGSGDVTRNGEVVRLADWEKVSFQAESPRMAKVKEIGPPTPISPANMMPDFCLQRQLKSVEFSWTPMANAAGYRLRISRNPVFFVHDCGSESGDGGRECVRTGRRRLLLDGAVLRCRGEGIGGKREEPVYHYSQGQRHDSINLDLDPLIQHGHVLEVDREDRGRSAGHGEWTGSADGRADGTFHYFTPPLPAGENRDHDYGAKLQRRREYATEKVVIQ